MSPMLNPKQLSFLIDIDGSISSDPPAFCDLMCALKADGNRVYVVSGSSPDSPSGPTWADKAAYLNKVGVTQCWDQLVVVSGDIPAQKALWCQQHGIDVAIDNDKNNAQAMIQAGVALVLVPWATRTPQKGQK